MPDFIVEQGSRVERCSISGTRVQFGRDEGNEIRIDDARVSREHALVEFHEGHWLLRDLGSANGTFQDDARVRRIRLERGSRFAIADVAEITFLGDEAVDAVEEGAVGSEAAPVAAEAKKPAADLPTVEGYEILDELGVGPFSRAFLAHDKLSGTAEVLRQPHHGQAGLEAAVRSWGRIDDPAVARLDFLAPSADQVFMRERFAREGTLADKLEAGHRYDTEEAIKLGLRLARGLLALHQHGIKMGVLRPSRVRLYDDAEPKIAGPGLLPIDLAPAASGACSAYLSMAPEHLREENPLGSPEVASDIYSWSAILYRIIAGAEPVEGKTLDALRRSVQKGPYKSPDDKRHGLPEGLSELIMSGLSQDPAARPRSVQDLIVSLEAVESKQKDRPKPQARQVMAKERELGERAAIGPKRSKKFKLISWTITLVLFVLLQLVVYLFYSRFFDN